MSRDIFRENAQDMFQPINLVGLGNDVLAAVSGVEVDDLDKAVTAAISQDIAAANNETLLGVASGSLESNNRLELFNKQLRDRLIKEAKAKGANSDLLLIDAYFNGCVGECIAREVFDNMSDEEIDACVIEIEQETGQSFEEYAKTKLGDDMPDRLPNEDDADYQRRVLKAITVEITDPKTGKIKPEYQDDPTARILTRNGKYQDIVRKVEGYNAKMDAAVNSGDLEAQQEISDDVRADAEQGYGVSRTTSGEVKHETVKEASADVQDEHRGDDFDSDWAQDQAGLKLASIIGAKPITPCFQNAACGEQAAPDVNHKVEVTEVAVVDIDLPKPV